MISDIYSVYSFIFSIHENISFAMSWWSWLFTSGSSIDESYSFTKSVNPSAAPDIDIIGVFRLCAIPPISCPNDDSLSLSIRVSWASFIFCISSICCVMSLNSISVPKDVPSDNIEFISI